MPPSKATLWAGRIISGLTTLSFLMDGVIRFFEPAPVVEATVKLGYPEAIIIGLGYGAHPQHRALHDSQ